MTEQPIQRNRYFDPPTFECDVNGRNLDEDIQNFHLLSSQAQLASLHNWGIADGLEVSGTLGSTTLTINPGVAVDAQGRLIVLATQGRGDLGSNPPGGNHNPVTVPVELDTSTLAGATDTSYYLTIEFSEILGFEGSTDCGRLEQAPWLRLQPVSGFTEDGTAVVLAVVTLGTSGQIVALTHQDSSLPVGRHLLGKTLGQLQIRRSQTTSETITEVNAGKLEALASGGLQLSVTNPSDQIILNQLDGGNFSSLTVQADTLTTPGNVGIGTTTPTAKLEVTGDLRLEAGVAVNEFSADSTLNRNSELVVPTERAVKTYIDEQINQVNAELATKALLNGSVSEDFQTHNLTVSGNLTTTGLLDVQGDLQLGGADITDAGGTPRITIIDNGRLDLKEDNGGTALSIANNGFVGIGTTTPANRLDVSGSLSVSGSIDVQGDLRLRGADIRDAGNTSRIRITDNGSLSLRASSGLHSLTIAENRNVGIITTDPQARLHITGGSDAEPNSGGYLIVGNTNAANVAIDDNEVMARHNGAVSSLYLQASGGNLIIQNKSPGRVGIGISSPVTTLHVRGSDVPTLL